MPKFLKMYTKTYKLHIFDLMCEKEKQQEQQLSRSMDPRLSRSKSKDLLSLE